MKKTISAILVLLFIGQFAIAQKFNPDISEKSLVRVEITHGNKGYACSGFLWQHKNWIVTSLHAMKKGATYKVVYGNKYYRDAVVYKVYKDADLVLLKSDEDSKPLSIEVTPITSYSETKVSFGDKLYAQGYHGGATGHRTTPLEKGDANPEVLESLVVKKEELAALVNLGFPKIDLPVLFLSGSLLPGYSGSPIYNTKGELVGIGNGGLEKGQNNVSWAIPATYLNNLEQSTTSALPDKLEQISLLMSSQVEVDLTSSSGGEEAIQQLMEEQYAVYSGGALEFIKTKNRSFEQMYNTAYDPDNLDYFARDLEENGLLIDYSYIKYDIFEDVAFGVTIAVPEGSNLIYDPANGTFTADLTNYPLFNYFSLAFYGYVDHNYEIEDVDQAANLLLEQLDVMIGGEVGGFAEDEEYTYRNEIDDDREMVYVLYQGNNSFLDENQDEHMLGIYLTVLKDENRIFYSMATITIPIYQLADAFSNGIDCENSYDLHPDYCEYFEQYMRIMAACHLTTFSSINYAAD
ncbi:MAG: serine protease [Bacteroidales bacterium]|nr:serine protease [Bacteroidales bacterium]